MADKAAPLVEAISLDTLPKVGRSSELTDADKALAAAIASTAVNGQAAQLPTLHADKAAATKVASRMKRLVKAAGVVPEGKTGRARLVTVAATGDTPAGFKVAVYFGDPGTAPKKKAS